MADKTINCVDCKSQFVWTDGEQTFFKSKGLTNEPKRCPPCRKAKKDRQERQPARTAPYAKSRRPSDVDDAENG